MQDSNMALEVTVWMLTALIILATICIGVSKGILGDSVLIKRGPRDFLLDRLARYGDFFTISFMGRTYTVISSPETIKFVLLTAHTSFPGGYPMQFYRLLDHGKLTVDERYPIFRKIMLSAASGDGLQKLGPFISSLAEKTVKSWENQAVVNCVEELKKFTFNVGMHLIWRNVEPGSEEMDQIRNKISRIAEALVAFPINIPGFSFHKALKTRQVLTSHIRSEISRRKAGIHQDDILNALMSIREVEVSDYDVCCIMVGLMFAATHLTTALILWVLKYLDNFPEVRQRVQEEQDCLRQKMIEDKSLTWFKPKSSMPYTLQVINEIMRIESLVMVIPRKASKDVDYNGLVFLKGSYLWASTTSRHYDSKYYPNPQEFDPSRFVEKPQPNAFMPFGYGPHLCPRGDIALTQTMFIIHHLVANYRWERCGLDKGVTQHPIRQLVGFLICLVKRCKT